MFDLPAHEAIDQLPEAVRSMSWIFAEDAGAIRHAEFARLLVIGVAPWARREMRAIEALAASRPRFPVAVFDIDRILTAERVRQLLPDATGVLASTPLVGEYENGRPVAILMGLEALARLTQLSSEAGWMARLRKRIKKNPAR